VIYDEARQAAARAEGAGAAEVPWDPEA